MRLRLCVITAILLGSMLAARPARAQNAPDPIDHQNELYVSWGLGSVQEFVSVFGSIIDQVIRNSFGGESYTENDDSTGAIGIGYNRHLTPRWTLGGIANFVRYTRTATSMSGMVERARDDYFTVMARTDFRWVNAQYFQIYSSLALGGTYVHSYQMDGGDLSHNGLIYAGQINLLGLRVGHNIGAFLELGFGWNGLIAAGASGTF